MSSEYVLWSNEEFQVLTLKNPHISAEEGLHVIVTPKQHVESAWSNPELCGKTFELAAHVCAAMERLGLAPWFNLQANGNWGLLPGGVKRFHIHIYARRKGATWGMPVQLPLSPDSFHNEEMSEKERHELSEALLRVL